MPQPRNGSELARLSFNEVVGPLPAEHQPGLGHAAARLGSGSDVLGLDDDRSRDHDWGLRLTLLVADDTTADRVRHLLEAHLPESFAGHPTRFATTWDPSITHKVDTSAAAAFIESRLGVDPSRLDDPTAWLALTGQSVLEVTAGDVFADTDGTLTAARAKLTWYPDDVWRYVVAAGWQRVSQELAMVGRCGDSGDDLGSRLVAARLARDLMHLGFLVERVWPPYPKWFATLFDRLRVAETAGPALVGALAARGWRAREAALAAAATAVHARQRHVDLPTVPEPVVAFWDRPYLTISTDLVAALTGSITDPVVAALPVGVGSVEQWVDNVDVLAHPAHRTAAAAWTASSSET